jgi:hypothetical protein
MGSGPFKAGRGRVKVALAAVERELLARLLDDVAGLLAESADTAAQASATSPGDSDWAVLEAALSAPPPQDPAVARLLPDGNRDDPELAQGFRRLTEHGLRERKRGGLSLAAAALRRPEPVVLDRSEAGALLKGLTDVRLVVAERLGLRTDEDTERLHDALRDAAHSSDRGEPAEEDWIGAAAIYDALTWWQESLVSALH